MKRSELVRKLAAIEGFSGPQARREQVATPVERACDLLEEALQRGDLLARRVVDLGSGTGMLAIGAALLGAGEVVGVEVDPNAVRVARKTAKRMGVKVEFRAGDVAQFKERADTVIMNPPFGAQLRHADRPFWDAALGLADGAVYAFALSESRSFIARRAVERNARVEETHPVAWALPATFPHHRKRRVELEVDLWILRPANFHERGR